VDELERGWEHQRAGRLGDAEACYRRFLAGNPTHAAGWVALGGVAVMQQNYEEAIRCYERSLALQPGEVQLLTSLGAVHALRRDFPAAEKWLRQATLVRPSFIEAYRNLGHALRDQGKFSEAVDAYQQALKLGPDDANLRTNVNDAFSKAEALYRGNLARDPTDASSYNGLGILYSAMKRFPEAESAYRQAVLLEAKPKSAPVVPDKPLPANSPSRQAVPSSEAENLRRWRESGQPQSWVQAHRGQWNHEDWLALLETLKRSGFWPLKPEDVGAVLEEIKRHATKQH
jgi:tetratricopeptide (TPR) repeat protein